MADDAVKRRANAILACFERVAGLALQEELKSMPWQAVWDYYCLLNNVPVGENYISEIQKYEQTVTSKR